MANSNGPSSARNMLFNGKTSVLPPKIPFPCMPSSSYAPGLAVAVPKQRDVASHHLRSSSEIEEKPSWLDDLLNEPETPLRKGCHRRSSSDSFAYSDLANYGSMNPESRDDSSFDRNKSKLWEAPIAPPRGLYRDAGLWGTSHNADRSESLLTEKNDLVESGEKNCHSDSKSSETETKRTKQQYAQRSRVRRLQYIAELERTVQALQAEGSQASAEIEFINQKNFIMSMENKALSQRLDGVAQEQHIKYLEHDMLEREVARLRNLYQQQQQNSSPNQRLAITKDIEKQFSTSLTLKPNEAGNAGD